MPPPILPMPPVVPTPAAPAPTAKAPEAPPKFSGTVRMVTFSDSIATGENAKASNRVDFERVESALKRVPGVSQAGVLPESRSMEISFEGPWTDLKKLEFAVSATGVSAEIINPARVVLRSAEDMAKGLEAVRTLPGVHFVTRENNDAHIYCDLEQVSLDEIREKSRVRTQVISHEEIRISFTSSGDRDALKADLERTKWVIRALVDGTVWVLAPKGRVTKALIKSVMAKNGFAPSK